MPVTNVIELICSDGWIRHSFTIYILHSPLSCILWELNSFSGFAIEMKRSDNIKCVQNVACITWFMHKFGTRSRHKMCETDNLTKRAQLVTHQFIWYQFSNGRLYCALWLRSKLTFKLEFFFQFNTKQMQTYSAIKSHFGQSTVKHLRAFQCQATIVRTFWNRNGLRLAHSPFEMLLNDHISTCCHVWWTLPKCDNL